MSEILNRAADAALGLANDRPWGEITLRDIAEGAGVPFAELYAEAGGKPGVIDGLSRRFDLAAASAEIDRAEDAHDRLFEATMARLEAMEPHRFPLIAIGRAEGWPGLAPRLPRTARALLETAGIDTAGVTGAARVAAMTATWARILQVWRDDEGALNRTMAEIDARLKSMREALRKVKAGF